MGSGETVSGGYFCEWKSHKGLILKQYVVLADQTFAEVERVTVNRQ